MKQWVCAGVVACLLLISESHFYGQGSSSQDELAARATREYLDGKYAEAERDLRELVKRDPSNVHTQIFLGHALFQQKKYAEAVFPYERARVLVRAGSLLSKDEQRVLMDQLVMSYGISGQLNKAHALLTAAIQQDSEYPLNYYNLACVFSEQGQKDKMLANLALAFRYKGNVVKGGKMPDPRSDSSFQKYIRDPDFVQLMQNLGYK